MLGLLCTHHVCFLHFLYLIEKNIFFCLQEAIDCLLKKDGVIPGQVGVIGTSKGGDIALMMATHSPKVTLCRMLFTLYTLYT